MTIFSYDTYNYFLIDSKRGCFGKHEGNWLCWRTEFSRTSKVFASTFILPFFASRPTCVQMKIVLEHKTNNIEKCFAHVKIS